MLPTGPFGPKLVVATDGLLKTPSLVKSILFNGHLTILQSGHFMTINCVMMIGSFFISLGLLIEISHLMNSSLNGYGLVGRLSRSRINPAVDSCLVKDGTKIPRYDLYSSVIQAS